MALLDRQLCAEAVASRMGKRENGQMKNLSQVKNHQNSQGRNRQGKKGNMQANTHGQADKADKRPLQESARPEVGKLLSGFRVEEGTDIPDAKGRLWKMTHEKSGAVLFWLDREDEEKTFVIAFKTLPEDDTGVAHILEHAVLDGSEKYPLKSTFEELRKSSLATFMNAMTFADATYYPFATRNDADFLNLADVYLDAVFHPLVLKDPRAFRREGWHYEVDDASGELSVNGVVFNEMKQSAGLPTSLAWHAVLRALYPGTAYAHNSGGDPEHIPELTHEALCAFHRRFYHGSNALVFLDGKVPLGEILGKLDASLSGFARKRVENGKEFCGTVDAHLRIFHETSESCGARMLVQGWSLGLAGEPSALLPWMSALLADYLCGDNESPLSKALLERGLCKAVEMTPSPGRQLSMILEVEGVAEKDLEECRKTIRNTLEEICAQGVDRARLQTMIDVAEHSARERKSGHYHFCKAIFTWLYGGDPRAVLSLSTFFPALRAAANDGLFERMIREKLLDGRQRAEVVMVPDAGLARRHQEEWAARMARLKASMTPEQIAAIAKEAAELAAYQREKELLEKIDLIPRVKKGDLSWRDIALDHEMEIRDGVTILRVPAGEDGIVHAWMHFPLDAFGVDELLRMPLYSVLTGGLGTSRRSAIDLQTAVAAQTRALWFSPLSAKRGRYFSVGLSVQPDKAETAFGLLKEILFETRYDEIRKIETVLRQMQLGIEQAAVTNGSDIATRQACRGLSEKQMVSDLLGGELQLRWLQETTATGELSEWLGGVRERLFRREGLILSHTDNLPNGVLEVFLGCLNAGDVLPRVRIDPVPGKVKGFAIDGDTGVAVWVAALPDGMKRTGAMKVASRVISREYLHPEVRETGGAYGSWVLSSPDDFFECWSFGDPTPGRSLDIMGRIGRALRDYVQSGADFERLIPPIIADMDVVFTPKEKASLPVGIYLDRFTAEDRERLRREILGTTREQLLEFADVLDQIAPSAQTCRVGGSRQLADLDPRDIQAIVPLQGDGKGEEGDALRPKTPREGGE